jgi:hypothetical protein
MEREEKGRAVEDEVVVAEEVSHWVVGRNAVVEANAVAQAHCSSSRTSSRARVMVGIAVVVMVDLIERGLS